MRKKENTARVGGELRQLATVRWHGEQRHAAYRATLREHPELATLPSVDCGSHLYVRGVDPLQGTWAQATLLPEGCECYELTCATTDDAATLLNTLNGGGGLASAIAFPVDPRRLLIEAWGDQLFLFAYIETILDPRRLLQRRSLFALHDSTLIRIAAQSWNCDDLGIDRILEVAAGEAAW